MSEQPHRRIRASDTDREQIAEVVRQAMGEGRLSLAEGEERLAAVYAATYQDELGAFTEDLPPTGPAGTTPGTAQAGRPPRSHPRTGGTAPGAAGEPAAPAGGGQSCSGPRLGAVPLVLVAALAALAAGWAILGGGPGWPAILLGVVAVIGAKHRWYAYLGSRDGDSRHHGWVGHHGWAGHWAGRRS